MICKSQILKLGTYVILLTLSYGLSAQSLDTAMLSRYLDTLEAKDKFMGMVSVSKGDKLMYSKTIGYSDLEALTKAKSESKYRIGSISKTFTAVLAMRQVEEGTLSLDQRLSEFFPSVANSDSITIRQLLQHRSGIHNFTSDTTYMSYHTQAQTREQMLERISQLPSDFKPGESFGYSNSNYVLLTYILEDVTAQSYPDLVDSFITTPLGIQNTYVGGKIDVKNKECKSYTYDLGWELQEETDMSIPLGAGAIVSNASDLVVFIDALINAKLVKKESLKQMTDLQNNYGLGLTSYPFNRLRGFGHTGGIDGFSSIVVHFPDSNLSYAFTSNGSNMNANEVSLNVLNAVTGNQVQMSTEKRVYRVSPDELKKYVGVYTSDRLNLDYTLELKKDTLYAQLTGQNTYALTPIDKDVFSYSVVEAEIHIEPIRKEIILKQGGKLYVFKKKEEE